MLCHARFLLIPLFTIGLGCLAPGCNEQPPPDSSFYDERINPTLQLGCVQQTSGCHLADERGFAVGNLDLSSFDALMRRADVLPAYGPYPVGLLLLKGGRQAVVQVETLDPPDPTKPEERFVRLNTDIRHNAGQGIALDSSGYTQVQEWISAGFTRTGLPTGVLNKTTGDCSPNLGSAPGFDPSAAPADGASYNAFVSDVQPMLREACGDTRCHGTTIADLYLACGDTEEESRWNYFSALQHLTFPSSMSELLRRPLALSSGGTYHEGGDVFASTDDEAYRALRTWSDELVERAPQVLERHVESEGMRFFVNRVQPVLVRKGCMFLNCHSPAMFHDLRLRGGSQGTFSWIGVLENYEMSRLLLGIESPNPNNSRLIAKNLFPVKDVAGGVGIAHRGGALLEDFSKDGAFELADPTDCDGVDADGGDLDEVPGYCVLTRWHQIEREAALAAGELTADDGLDGVVWVARPTDVGEFRDFDTFRGGADLRYADATLGSDGSTTLGASTSLLGGCGLSGNVDVRTPAVSWSGDLIAFAARATASEPLRLYTVKPDGSGCAPLAGVAASRKDENGILIHDFDPAFAPNDSIVFASTRGNLDGEGLSYQGPTRTPAAMQPNANLYVFEEGRLRQLTFLLNQELAPNFMADGRAIFTTEKRQPEFHQLAARRQNLDGGDYHPLFGQRDSVGFSAATEVAELPNRNLVFVASSPGAADGAGTIVVANRSIGPDQQGRDPADRFYLHSMHIPYQGSFGGIAGIPALNAAPTGVFRSPAPLPSGRILVSCDLNATALDRAGYAFQLCELDPYSGEARTIGGESSLANVEAVAVYGRPQVVLFESRADEPNAHTEIVSGEKDAIIQVHDFPLLATLLFQNTREGRPIDARIKAFEVLQVLPPPSSAASFSDLTEGVADDAFGQQYVRHESLGTVGLEADGSARFRFRGGVPILLRVLDGDGNPLLFEEGGPFTGEIRQREQMQFYPGERANQSLPRHLFNGLCGGCHGSISNRELDIAVNVDVLTGASRTLSYGQGATDLFR